MLLFLFILNVRAVTSISVVAIEKGAFELPSTTFANFTYFYIYIYICIYSSKFC